MSLADVNVLILSTSLGEESRSRLVARSLEAKLINREVPVTLVDLSKWNIPTCCSSDPAVRETADRLDALVAPATHVIFASPIHNLAVHSAAKNVIELMTGGSLYGKTVGFVCAAGGQTSYMAPLSLASAVMQDFRCWVIPRFIVATGTDFFGDTVGPKLSEEIDSYIGEMFSRATVLSSVGS